MNESKTSVEELSPLIAKRIAQAPMPTKATLRLRHNLIIQFFKFAAFNLRILKIVTVEKLKSHK